MIPYRRRSDFATLGGRLDRYYLVPLVLDFSLAEIRVVCTSLVGYLGYPAYTFIIYYSIYGTSLQLQGGYRPAGQYVYRYSICWLPCHVTTVYISVRFITVYNARSWWGGGILGNYMWWEC